MTSAPCWVMGDTKGGAFDIGELLQKLGVAGELEGKRPTDDLTVGH